MDRIEVALPLSEQLANIIRKSIISGELKGGEKVSVSMFSRELGVSATPVKEAFKILQSEGLLTTKERSGTIISDFAANSLESMAFIRGALEGTAVNLATRASSDNDLEGLLRILDKSDDAIRNNDLETLVTVNTAFHRRIRELARNQYLYNLIEKLVSFDYTFRNSALSAFELRKKGSFEHRGIAELMIKRKLNEAEKEMVWHIRHTAIDVMTMGSDS